MMPGAPPHSTEPGPERPGGLRGQGWLVLSLLIGSVTLAALAIRSLFP